MKNKYVKKIEFTTLEKLTKRSQEHKYVAQEIVLFETLKIALNGIWTRVRADVLTTTPPRQPR